MAVMIKGKPLPKLITPIYQKIYGYLDGEKVYIIAEMAYDYTIWRPEGKTEIVQKGRVDIPSQQLELNPWW